MCIWGVCVCTRISGIKLRSLDLSYKSIYPMSYLTSLCHKFILKYFILIYLFIIKLCVYVHVSVCRFVHVSEVSVKARRRCWILLGWNYRQL